MTSERTSRWTVLAVLCLSLLAVVIDGTVVNTALPTLARDLDASVEPARSGSSTPTRSCSPACCSSPGASATASAASARSRAASSSSARPRWPRSRGSAAQLIAAAR